MLYSWFDKWVAAKGANMFSNGYLRGEGGKIRYTFGVMFKIELDNSTVINQSKVRKPNFTRTRTESAQNLWLIKMPWTFDIYKNKN